MMRYKDMIDTRRATPQGSEDVKARTPLREQ